MKLRRLPETDLARIAPLPREDKRVQLLSFNSGGGSWSYDPARNQNFNNANPRNPLALTSPAPSIDQIVQLVAAQSTCKAQKESCIEVVELFHNWFTENATDAVERNVPSMSVGSLGAVRYWENFVAMINGKPTFIFLDYRRQKGLTALGRKFVFSMMREQIRSVDPDFVDPELLALRFPQSKGELRRIVDHYAGDKQLFSLSELTGMVEETYEVWHEISTERREEPPKRAAGGSLL